MLKTDFGGKGLYCSKQTLVERDDQVRYVLGWEYGRRMLMMMKCSLNDYYSLIDIYHMLIIWSLFSHLSTNIELHLPMLRATTATCIVLFLLHYAPVKLILWEVSKQTWQCGAKYAHPYFIDNIQANRRHQTISN